MADGSPGRRGAPELLASWQYSGLMTSLLTVLIIAVPVVIVIVIVNRRA
jgi:hypothetical protein